MAIRQSILAAFLAAALGASGPALAAGGGGGGGGFSPPSAQAADPAAAYQRGLAALQQNDYRAAISAFRAVLESVPNDANSNYLLGLAYVGARDMRAARRPLERAAKQADGPPDARHQLGLVHIALGDRAKAEAELAALAAQIASCAQACGDQRRALLQAAHDKLSAALATPSTSAPTTGWRLPAPGEGRAAYARAVELVNSARYEDALHALDAAQALLGPIPDVLNYRGFASRRLGRYDAALAYYTAALAIDPDHRGANEYLGELYLELGRIEDAQRQLARLDRLCAFGCVEREELAARIVAASGR